MVTQIANAEETVTLEKVLGSYATIVEKIEVIDLIGKTILTFANTKTINIETIPAGAYYLRLTNAEKTSLQKVIKQ